jgi:hypothetical protein
MPLWLVITNSGQQWPFLNIFWLLTVPQLYEKMKFAIFETLHFDGADAGGGAVGKRSKIITSFY